jgi:hypothetical protein
MGVCPKLGDLPTICMAFFLVNIMTNEQPSELHFFLLGYKCTTKINHERLGAPSGNST